MADRNKAGAAGTPEFEVAYYTKELGKSLQREMLQKQLNHLTESTLARKAAAAEAAGKPQPPEEGS